MRKSGSAGGRRSGLPTVSATDDETVAQNAALRELVTIYRQLSGLAIQDDDLVAVTELVADQTQATVAVLSPSLDVVSQALRGKGPAEGPDVDDGRDPVAEFCANAQLPQTLNAAARAKRVLRLPRVGKTGEAIVGPVFTGDEASAFLIVLVEDSRQSFDDFDLLIVEHATTVCGIILGRERLASAASRQVRDDLVQGLLSSSGRGGPDVDRWAKYLGYNVDLDHRVLVISLEPSEPEEDPSLSERAAATAERLISSCSDSAITTVHRSEAVGVIDTSTEPDAAHRVANACTTRLRELYARSTVTAGIGGVCRTPEQIGGSYSQARRTVEALCRLGQRGRVAAFDELGIYRLLLLVPDLADVREFAHGVLGVLIQSDRAKSSQYLLTLQTYFRENGNHQRVARELYVHPNTVAYRLHRIEAMTGLDLDDSQHRLMLQLALEIVSSLGAPE